MRLFRKKSGSQSGHQEYLDGLISSIRQARRDEEEKPGLHSFVEDDYYPGSQPGTPTRVPPGVAKPGKSPDNAPVGDDAEAVKSLEAYLSELDAAEAAKADEEPEGEGYQSG